METTKQAIGYIRVSTTKQSEEGVSLEAQEARIKAWCLANGYTLASIHIDAGISGKRMDNRPGLQEALKRTTKGTALVVYSLSRLARSTKDAITMGETLDKRGADLVSLSEKIDTSGAAGKMVFRMLAVLAEFERDLVSERTSAALAHKKSIGEKYSPTPFGYEDHEGKLEVVEDEAKVVAEIVSLRHAGSSYRDIANELNARGVSGKKGGRWHPGTVRYIELNRKVA